MDLNWFNAMEQRLAALEDAPPVPLVSELAAPSEFEAGFEARTLQTETRLDELSSKLETRLSTLEAVEPAIPPAPTDLSGIEARLGKLEAVLDDIRLNVAEYIPQTRPYDDADLRSRLEKLEKP